MDERLKHLHILEDQIIELEYLVKTMQRLDENNGVRITILNIFEEKIVALKAVFYQLWQAQFP